MTPTIMPTMDASPQTTIKSTRIVSSQEILKEMRNFVSGATFGTKYSRTELARSAIFLLKTLPSAREAILEYLCTIFDDAVNIYSLNLELEMTNSSSTPTSSVVQKSSAVSETDDTVIPDVQDILSGFISQNAEGWAPIVSSWSLDLLGQLSSKYAERRGVLHASSLNEVLQLWMSCRPTRTLVDLSTQCISTLMGSDSDHCIDALLDTSVQHSPYFDWVVAHIGSCFPTMIITRVLACGLKDFCSHGNNEQQQGTGLLPTPDTKVPKVTSVVGILGHLASQHSDDIRNALLSLFEDSFVPNPTPQQLATVPFVLQLASMSCVLRKVITNDFIKVLTPKILNDLCVQIPQWHRSASSQDPEDLINLVVHMILQSEDGSGQIIHFLLNTAAPSAPLVSEYLPQVPQVCGRILDTLLLQIQYLVNSKSNTFPVEVPVLSTLHEDIGLLCQHLFDNNGGQKAYWLSKLLCCLAAYSKEEHVMSDIISHVLTHAKTRSHLSILSHLLTLMEPTASRSDLDTTISQILTENIGRGKYCPELLLKNIWSIVQWECDGVYGFGKTRLRFSDHLSKFLIPLSKQILHPKLDAGGSVMNTLASLNLPDEMSMSTLTSLCTSTISYFFVVVHEGDIDTKISRVPVCCKFVSKLCEHLPAQHLILRALLEGSLNAANASNFGGAVAKASECQDSDPATVILLKENQKHAVSITLPQSHSTIFHTGIIGDGLRTLKKSMTKESYEILINVQLLMEMVKSACVPYNTRNNNTDEKPSADPVPSIKGMTNAALLLVERVSSDVMFNGLPWPEEEFAKVTIERDLHIKRMFDENPILWNFMYLVANYRPALCYCSVLLRALAAVLMSFWASCQERSSSNCPKQLDISCRLIEVMAIGQLLPPPISHIAEVLPKISPYEVYILLADVWKYMKDNVPTPVAFATLDSQGYPWRDFGNKSCDRKYTNRLHCILQSNIGKFGHLFFRFFAIEDGQ